MRANFKLAGKFFSLSKNTVSRKLKNANYEHVILYSYLFIYNVKLLRITEISFYLEQLVVTIDKNKFY